jgi:hypothetical protein
MFRTSVIFFGITKIAQKSRNLYTIMVIAILYNSPQTTDSTLKTPFLCNQQRFTHERDRIKSVADQ